MSPHVIAVAMAVAIVAVSVYVALSHVLSAHRRENALADAKKRARSLVHRARSTTRTKDAEERRRSVRYIHELQTVCDDFGFRLEDVGTNRRQLDMIIFLTRQAILADPKSLDPTAIRWRLNPDEPGNVTIEVDGSPETSEELEIVIPLDLPELPATTSLERVEAAMARDLVMNLPNVEEVMAAIDRLTASGELLTSIQPPPANWTELKLITDPRLKIYDVKTLQESLPEHHDIDDIFQNIIDESDGVPKNGHLEVALPEPVDFGEKD